MKTWSCCCGSWIDITLPSIHSVLQVMFMKYCVMLRCKPTYSLNMSTLKFLGHIFLICFNSWNTQRLDRFSAQNDSLTLLPKELKISTWTFFLMSTNLSEKLLGWAWTGRLWLQTVGHLHLNVRIWFRKSCNICLYQALLLELSHIAWPCTSLFFGNQCNIFSVFFFLTCHCFAWDIIF